MDEVERRIVALRAGAHPVRLRMLSLLTAQALSAAELARVLGVSQALASYHLRRLADADVVELAEERIRRGGRERRYRYRVTPDAATQPPADLGAQRVFVEAVLEEVRRRNQDRVLDLLGLTVDLELWIDPDDWEQARREIEAVARRLHEGARSPNEAGTVHVSTSVFMFPMINPAATPAADPQDQSN